MKTFLTVIMCLFVAASNAATVYPSSLDNFANPISSSQLATGAGGRSHSQMHGDLNDAIEAVQAQLGVVASAVAGTVHYRLGIIETAIAAWTASSTNTVTNKTINGASNTLTVLAGSQLSGQTPLANGGFGVALTDPNADRLTFWDDSAGNFTWLTLGDNLSISGTTINATGGSGTGGVYGDGRAGALTTSSGVTTVSTFGYVAYSNLTISGTASVYTQGRVIFADELDLSAAPANAIETNGEDAAAAAAGTVLTGTNRQTPVAVAGSNAGNSATTNGTQASATTNSSFSIITDAAWGNSGRGGAGGASAPRTGGAARTVAVISNGTDLIQTAPTDPTYAAVWQRNTASNNATVSGVLWGTLGTGGAGGGGGAGNSTQLGTGGGGGGGAAGPTIVYARRIKIGAGTAACAISAVGGLGASSSNATNTDTAAGGGGGGGGGGLLIVVTDEVYSTDSTASVAGALCASGGNGGSAGTSNGAATDGEGGYSGHGGRIILWNRGLGTTVYAGPVAGVANSGRTGGTATPVTAALTAN